MKQSRILLSVFAQKRSIMENEAFFLIVCNMECMGKAYSYLRLSKTVFSIFFLENDVYRLIKSFPKCKVNFINYLDDVDNPSENIQSNINYGCVFVIRQVSYYSKAIFAMFEAKVKRMSPSDFAYTYSYHLAENEYRKFMVFHHKQKIALSPLTILRYNCTILVIRRFLWIIGKKPTTLGQTILRDIF